MLESEYQSGLKRRLEKRFPGIFIMKNDEQMIQGIPDLILLYKDKWAILEVKRSSREPYRPNQEYYLELLGSMSFSATIYPENEKEVLDALQQAFGPRRSARLSQRQ